MKKNTIFLKIFSGYLSIVVILVMVILLLVLQELKVSNRNAAYRNLLYVTDALSQTLKPKIANGKITEVKDLIGNISKKYKLRFTLIEPIGRVLIDTMEDPQKMENHKDRPEVLMALSGSIGREIRYSKTMQKEMLYVAVPVKNQNNIIAILRSSIYLEDSSSLMANVQKVILGISILLLLIAGVFAYFLAHSLLSPLSDVEQVLQKYKSADFKARVQLQKDPEWLDLAKSINSLGGHMENLLQELKGQQEQLTAIIESMQEGLIVVKGQEIVLANQAFKAFLGDKAEQYLSILRDPIISEMIRKSKTGRVENLEWLSFGKTFLVSCTFLELRQEVVLLFRDITELKNIEQVQKDFVINVSHELRTPLTALKGFTELLKAESAPEQKKYAEIIENNTERLINIVNDLLVLTEMQEKTFNLQKEKTDIKSLLQKTVLLFEPRVKAKGLQLLIECSEDLPQLEVDSFKLEQVLINLLDNAVKYTDKGSIIIKVKPQGSFLNIEVKDTGVGISPEDISRIFDRFYVVDKSRSRKLGGTGLGLSIVKHIVLLHGGTITVESEPGQGSNFKISLPQK